MSCIPPCFFFFFFFFTFSGFNSGSMHRNCFLSYLYFLFFPVSSFVQYPINLLRPSFHSLFSFLFSFYLKSDTCFIWHGPQSLYAIWNNHYHRHVDSTESLDSLSPRPYRSSLLAGPLDCIRCPHRADLCKSLLVGHRPCVRVHKRTSLMSLSLLVQQWAACHFRLIRMVCEMAGMWSYNYCFLECLWPGFAQNSTQYSRVLPI